MGSTFESAVGSMRAAFDGFEHAEVLLREAADRFDEARAVLVEVTVGAVNEKVAVSVARLGEVLDALAKAYPHLAGGLDEFGEYMSEIGADGITIVSVPLPERATTRAPFEPSRPNRVRETVMRRIGWPKKSNGDTRARGLAFFPDGSSLGTEDNPLRASRKGPASKRADLKPAWADPQMRTTWHVEGHVAAIMVDRKQRQAIVYVNQPVCGAAQPRHPQRCAENLQHVLPVGYTMTVHAVRENGWVEITHHHGTGEAIKNA